MRNANIFKGTSRRNKNLAQDTALDIIRIWFANIRVTAIAKLLGFGWKLVCKVIKKTPDKNREKLIKKRK